MKASATPWPWAPTPTAWLAWTTSAGVTRCSPKRPRTANTSLAQLVRACKALSELCVAYGVPCISGKDSMKNDYTGGGKKISIPPTVLFSVLGIMDDVKKAVTSDFKKPGDRLYIIGNTARELAGSEIADQLGIACNTVPRVDAKSALASYRKLHQAINSRLISACHDLSDGGLAVSLAEMCIGGRLGAHLALNRVPVIGALTLTEALYSESASRLLVSVAPDKAAEFEALFGASAPFIGEVTSDARLTVASADSAAVLRPRRSAGPCLQSDAGLVEILGRGRETF